MKRNLHEVLLIGCAVILVGLVPFNAVRSDSGSTATRSSSTIRFVVRIPETLHLRIAESAESSRPANWTAAATDRAIAIPEHVDIDIVGNLDAGRMISLTSDPPVSPSVDGNRHQPGVRIAWTATTTLPSAETAGTRPSPSTGAGSSPSFFSYHATHPLPTGLSAPITFTLSVP